ncbi:MAG: sulfate adenylyltransferase [Candidatus Brocadiaceae bacterium]|nr:sulfate adenylyltransferase [Candidatus Brocadiaceae bacterium]
MEKEILCTIGPASLKESVLRRLNELPVTLLRINLSHTRLKDLSDRIRFIQTHSSIPICLDTEGAQIRTGRIIDGSVLIQESRTITIHKRQIAGDSVNISFYPTNSIDQLEIGDLICIDFDTALVQIIEKDDTVLHAKVITEGVIGSNKAVSVNRPVKLDFLTEKDRKAINIALELGVRHIALSFASTGKDVELFRQLVGSEVFVISKIENLSGLKKLDEIIELSDAILVDRGDLSRDIPIESIPVTQKYILGKARALNTKIYVATNFLDSMVNKNKPSGSECNDVINTLVDGADGIVLAAETAIGKNPIGTINMVYRLIRQHEIIKNSKPGMENIEAPALLIEPHGGVLVDSVSSEFDDSEIKELQEIEIDERTILDCQQIATGVYSPLNGFMTEEEMESVLDHYCLPNGVVWTLPIILQLSKIDARRLKLGDKVILVQKKTRIPIAQLSIESIFTLKFESFAKRWFGTTSEEHPGVSSLKKMGETIVGGEIRLLTRNISLESSIKEYVFTPKETRLIFEQKHWFRVIGFHTRNIVHRAHEFIQMEALEEYHCDGIYISPVIGPKKEGDFTGVTIMEAYQLMLDYHFYPKNKVFLGAFHTYSRYSGPREAVFTAICRKNFGCSHFIIGRDHTGVGNFYDSNASVDIFDKIGEIGIKPIFFDEVAYCSTCNCHRINCNHSEDSILRISGTDIRNILNNGGSLPDWLVRDEINELLLEKIKLKQPLFLQ